MTHTKGPWNLSNPKTRIIGIKPAPEAPDESGNRLAQVTFSYTPTSFDYPACQIELEANARLIAAAPDMLEALESCLNEYKNPLDPETRKLVIPILKNIINKAKGVI